MQLELASLATYRSEKLDPRASHCSPSPHSHSRRPHTEGNPRCLCSAQNRATNLANVHCSAKVHKSNASHCQPQQDVTQVFRLGYTMTLTALLRNLVDKQELQLRCWPGLHACASAAQQMQCMIKDGLHALFCKHMIGNCCHRHELCIWAKSMTARSLAVQMVWLGKTGMTSGRPLGKHSLIVPCA